LSATIKTMNGTVHEENDHGLTVGGLTSDEIGKAAFDAGISIFELTPQRASLEEVFMDLTAGAVEFGGAQIGSAHHE
jgi:ABC-2 type transport system ATP-binding protein